MAAIHGGDHGGCFEGGRGSMSAEVTRFFAKVDTSGPCWEWTAALTRGYGVFGASGRTVRAHRYCWELLVGPIPEGAQLDHLCRNRACVNPDHLEVVDGATNTLRGNGPTARNARKTHCPKGHPYEGRNLIRHKRGGRGCRTCYLEADKRYRGRL